MRVVRPTPNVGSSERPDAMSRRISRTRISSVKRRNCARDFGIILFLRRSRDLGELFVEVSKEDQKAEKVVFRRKGRKNRTAFFETPSSAFQVEKRILLSPERHALFGRHVKPGRSLLSAAQAKNAESPALAIHKRSFSRELRRVCAASNERSAGYWLLRRGAAVSAFS